MIEGQTVDCSDEFVVRDLTVPPTDGEGTVQVSVKNDKTQKRFEWLAARLKR